MTGKDCTLFNSSMGTRDTWGENGHRKVSFYLSICPSIYPSISPSSSSPIIPSLKGILYPFARILVWLAWSDSPYRKLAERGSCFQEPVFSSGCSEMCKSDNHKLPYLLNFFPLSISCSGRCKKSVGFFLRKTATKLTKNPKQTPNAIEILWITWGFRLSSEGFK